MKQTNKRLSLLLAILLILNTLGPLTAVAVDDPVYTGGEVTAFAPLAADVSAQTVQATENGEAPPLPQSLVATATVMSPDPASVGVDVPVREWVSTPAFDSAKPGDYRFAPVLQSDWTSAGGVELPAITVTVEAPAAPAAKTISAFVPLAPESARLDAPFGTTAEQLPLPATLTATVDGETAEVPVQWICEEYDAQTTGEYSFAAVLPTDYALAESVAAPAITVAVLPAARAPLGIGVQSIITDVEGNYSFDTATNTLYIHYDPGVTAWKSDSRINKTLITSLSVGDAVTALPANCFKGLNLTGLVDISNSAVTTIGDECFLGTPYMTGIKLPASVQTLGSNCFKDSGLRGELDLSSATSLTTIGVECFAVLSGITSIKLPAGVQTLGDRCFYKTGITGSLNLSNVTGLQTIGESCFHGISTLTGLTLPANVQTLGASCFVGTGLFGTLDLAAATSLTTIGNGCFANLPLTTVTWPASLQTIGQGAFAGTRITDALDLSGTALTTIGQSAFSGIPTLTTLALPASLQTIGQSAFLGTRLSGALDLSGCTALTAIGAEAFSNVSALTGLVLPNSLSTLGGSAFASSGLANFVLDLSNTALTTIPDFCFSDTFIKGLVLPAGIQTLGHHAFSHTLLNSTLDLSANTALTAIGDECFSGCSGITTLLLPTSLQSLGVSCFKGTTLLYPSAALDLSGLTALTSIGEKCFQGQSFLSGILLPEGLQTLGNACFENSGLSGSVRLPGTLTAIGQNAFTNTALTSLLFTGNTAPAMPLGITHAGVASYYPAAAGVGYLAQPGLPKPAYPYGGSTDAKIISFTLWGEPGAIDEENKRIYVTIPDGIVITSRVPTIGFLGDSISPAQNVLQDFTSSVIYTVTPASGAPVSYTVYVLRGAILKSQTIHLGQTATFTVDVPAATAVQWQVNKGDGNGFIDVPQNEGSGAQTTAYTTPTAPVEAAGLAMSGWSYRAKLTVNGLPNNAAFTAAVSLTVTKIPRDPPVIRLVSSTDTSVTLTPLENVVYQDYLTEAPSNTTGIFTNLGRGSRVFVYAAYFETETHLASGLSNIVVIYGTSDKTPVPVLTDTMAFGQTLGADTSAFSHVSAYQWMRDDVPIPGADSSTYKLTAEDVGAVINLRVAASAPYFGWYLSTNTNAVVKASQAAPAAPTLASRTDAAITLNTITGAEYRRGTGDWQSSPTFTGLSPNTSYTFYARLAETTTHGASSASTGAQFSTTGPKLPQTAPPAPELVGVATATSITVKKPTGVTADVQFACMAGNTAPESSDWQTGGTFSGLTPNTAYKLYMRLAETDTHAASAASEALPVTTTKAALGGTVRITGNHMFNETLTANTSDLTTTPANADKGTLSYQWLRGGATISGATASTYTLVAADIGAVITVRVSAANCTGTVTSTNDTAVAKASQDAPAAPTGADKTDTSITLTAITGAEYRLSTGTWQSSSTFTGLSPNTSYTFYARLKETTTHEPSLASAASDAITTLKTAQNAPVAPVQDGVATATSIAVKKPAGVTADVEFACMPGTTAPGSSDWQTGSTFSGLTPNTAYKLYMRLAETTTHAASAASAALTVTTAKAALSGTVSITGNHRFAETLTANTNGLTTTPANADKGMLSYQWLRGDSTISGATASTYTLVAADVGAVITVRVSAANCTGTVTSTNNIAVEKADGPAAPTVGGGYTGDGVSFTYTVQAIVGAEYSKNGIDWQDSPIFGDFTTNSPQTIFYARIKETATRKAGITGQGDPVTFVLLNDRAAPPLDYAVTGSSDNRTITITSVDGAEYKFGDDDWGAGSSKGGYTGNETVLVQIRYTKNATHEAGPANTVNINLAKQHQSPPAGFALSYAWDGNTFTVTIPQVAGCEYSFDGVNYSGVADAHKKTGCAPGDVIVGYVRYVETATHNASPAASASVTLPTPATSVTVTAHGGATVITQRGGTLQLYATVLPAGANQQVTWRIQSGGSIATVSAGGLLTATGDGSVTVRATASDGTGVYGEITITLSGQTLAVSTIEHPDSGVSVKGRFAPGASITVTLNTLPHSGDACAACKEIRGQQDNDNLIVLCDISVSGRYEGTLEVSIPVGAQYNGQTLTVLHCAGGTCERLTFTVTNGYAVGTVTGLSPFAVLKPSGNNHNSTGDTWVSSSDTDNRVKDVPYTGDASNDPWLSWGVMLPALALMLFAGWQLKRLHKKRFTATCRRMGEDE